MTSYDVVKWNTIGSCTIYAHFCTKPLPKPITCNLLHEHLALQWRHNRLDSVSNHRASRLFTQQFIRAQIKETLKAPRHWPLCGEFTVTGEFPAQRARSAENVSIWWRLHATSVSVDLLFLTVKIQTSGVYPKHDLFSCEQVDPITAKQLDPHLCSTAVACIFLQLGCFTLLARLAKKFSSNHIFVDIDIFTNIVVLFVFEIRRLRTTNEHIQLIDLLISHVILHVRHLIFEIATSRKHIPGSRHLYLA